MRAVPHRAPLVTPATRRVRAGQRLLQQTEMATGTATASDLRPTLEKAPPTGPASVRTATPARATDQMACTRPSHPHRELCTTVTPPATATLGMENPPPSLPQGAPFLPDPTLLARAPVQFRAPVRVLTRAVAASPRWRPPQRRPTVRATALPLRPIGDRRNADERK
jgi:hypothetical protein